jgi:DNA-directed RNA polymerase specialized sigma24 family protein
MSFWYLVEPFWPRFGPDRTTVRRMQDHAVVAAVVAGDADGFAAAYDRYAASLYACCHTVLPGPDAAEAVFDTFLIAAAKLDGLRDPDRLGPWLHAVARNECLRRLGPGQEILAVADLGASRRRLRFRTTCAARS